LFADDPADADGEGMIEIEAVDGIAIFLCREQQTEETLEERVRSLEVEQLRGSSRQVRKR